jgi:hypothetical protein
MMLPWYVVAYHDFSFRRNKMEEKNYVLATSFGRSNIQNRLWYVMGAADLDTLKEKETILFGDKAFAINEK